MTDNKKFCTKCGTENSNDANFCTKCGSGISNTDETNITSTFCTKCGTKLNDSELYCQNCGQAASKLYAKETIDRITVLPQEIRDKLKNYKEIHQKVSCSECGYVGKMGIIKKILPWYGTWWGIFILVILSIPFVIVPAGWSVIVIVWGLVYYGLKTNAKYALDCPNCDTRIQTGR